jgi:hypothetical protein
MIIYLFYLFFVLGILWCFFIFKSVIWINNFQNKKILEKSKSNIKLFILIPVLNESAIIEDTALYFLNFTKNISINFKIVFITTERELLSNNIINTINIVKKLSSQFEKIIHLHYPFTQGRMAHQLNYGIKTLLKSYDVKFDDFFAVYNADSRPDKRTLPWVLNEINNKEKEVFQQYGNYCFNINNLNNSILFSSSLWQTRWSLGFEIYNSLKQSWFLNKTNKFFYYFRPVNYCIGHGLFFSRRVYEKVFGFDEDMHNEDAILGLKLCVFKKSINPVPYFDYCETTDSVFSLFRQQSSWFLGPFQAFKYYNKIKHQFNNINVLSLFILSVKLFFHSIYWLFGPIIFFIFLVQILFNIYYLSLFILVYLLYLVIPNFLTLLISENYKKIYKNKLIKAFFKILLGSLPFYFLHGLSAIYSVSNYIFSFFNGTPIKKDKTFMKRDV